MASLLLPRLYTYTSLHLRIPPRASTCQQRVDRRRDVHHREHRAVAGHAARDPGVREPLVHHVHRVAAHLHDGRGERPLEGGHDVRRRTGWRDRHCAQVVGGGPGGVARAQHLDAAGVAGDEQDGTAVVRRRVDGVGVVVADVGHDGDGRERHVIGDADAPGADVEAVDAAVSDVVGEQKPRVAAGLRQRHEAAEARDRRVDRLAVGERRGVPRIDDAVGADAQDAARKRADDVRVAAGVGLDVLEGAVAALRRGGEVRRPEHARRHRVPLEHEVRARDVCAACRPRRRRVHKDRDEPRKPVPGNATDVLGARVRDVGKVQNSDHLVGVRVVNGHAGIPDGAAASQQEYRAVAVAGRVEMGEIVRDKDRDAVGESGDGHYPK